MYLVKFMNENNYKKHKIVARQSSLATLIMEGCEMDIRYEFEKAINAGLPISFVAKKINKDPSTLNKWLHGTRKVSKEIEDAVEIVLLEVKEKWQHIL